MEKSLKFSLVILLSQLMVTYVFAEKTMYKWKANDGSIHYGDRVPPEETKKAYEVYNTKGDRVKAISRVKTKEEYRREDERNRLIQAKLQAAQLKRKEDQKLIRLYPSEEAVTRARDERIVAIDNGIALSTDALKLYNGNISSLRKTAADHARARKPVPNHVKKKIAMYRKMIQELNTSIANGRKKQQSIRHHYEKILTRYREIN